MIKRTERSTTDTAALLMIGIVGFFIVATMTILIVLAFAGKPGGENVWAGMFSLCTALLGAVGGYLGGTTIEKQKRNGNGNDKPPGE